MIFDKQNIAKLAKYYIEISKNIAMKSGIDLQNIFISKKGLENALTECITDIEIMQQRRRHKDLSAGKYAGILAYRLSKWNIVALTKDDKDYSVYPYAIALAFALKYVLNISITSLGEQLRKELIYVFAQRHTNQETLGLCFDTINYYLQHKQGGNLNVCNS